jgi:hypothetical protein
VLADHDKGTEHLPDEERKRLRGKFELRMNRAADTGIVLTDDLGTAYHATSSHGGGGGNERVGRTQFVPPIPREVTQLVVHWGELEFPVDLTPETMITPAPVRRDEVPPSGTSGLEPQGRVLWWQGQASLLVADLDLVKCESAVGGIDKFIQGPGNGPIGPGRPR